MHEDLTVGQVHCVQSEDAFSPLIYYDKETSSDSSCSDWVQLSPDPLQRHFSLNWSKFVPRRKRSLQRLLNTGAVSKKCVSEPPSIPDIQAGWVSGSLLCKATTKWVHLHLPLQSRGG